MPEKSRKVPFTEQDSAKLLERYDATTVLTLLQELAHYPHAKIDWNELVKKHQLAFPPPEIIRWCGATWPTVMPLLKILKMVLNLWSGKSEVRDGCICLLMN
ncbi:uncharacterized protein LOC130961476 isoform X2 [Arachis stenosperma]|uniref:uncharacterized protein LOC130961476 isoform X2 n=2 Tax=Arachis stenosperma TaxID=217475 RepID=UPI0025AD9121|nr:uncharacterized protein LOC130961476 isoform X2 [Arachis stenosperma]